MMLLSSLALVFVPIILAAQHGPSCLPSGDEKAINRVFQRGGQGTTVTLCADSTHMLHDSIVFTAARQTLTTEGNPKGRERAMLVVKGQNLAVAIRADCRECSNAMIRSVIIDGNRPEMLRVPKGEALVEMGNGEGHTIRDCRLYEPRGWSCLHLREGDLKQCTKAYIAGNDIGPCGEEYDDEYDGPDTEHPWNGNPRADGISLACKDSLVERNIVTDATDGGIVLFGSSGSEVRENHVYTRTRAALGGINLVDYDPWKGDYFGVKVHHNAIHAHGGYLRVGIVIGPASWGDDTESIVHSGWVTDNTLHGQNFGYGIVVSSVKNFNVVKNKVDPDCVFEGVPGPRCPAAPENGKPTAFLINKGSAQGTFQPDFINGEVQHIICIDPPPVDGVPYKPWRMRDDPNAESVKAKLKAAEIEVSKASLDSRLAEAVVLYQYKILTALGVLSDRIEQANHPVVDAESEEDTDPAYQRRKKPESGGKTKTGVKVLDDLERKIEVFESGEKSLQREMDAIHRELGEMSKKLKKAGDDARPILAGVFKLVSQLPTPPPPTNLRQRLSNAKSASSRYANFDIPLSWGKDSTDPWTWIIVGVVVLLLAGWMMRRWRRRGSGTKGKLY